MPGPRPPGPRGKLRPRARTPRCSPPPPPHPRHDPVPFLSFLVLTLFRVSRASCAASRAGSALARSVSQAFCFSVTFWKEATQERSAQGGQVCARVRVRVLEPSVAAMEHRWERGGRPPPAPPKPRHGGDPRDGAGLGSVLPFLPARGPPPAFLLPAPPPHSGWKKLCRGRSLGILERELGLAGPSFWDWGEDPGPRAIGSEAFTVQSVRKWTILEVEPPLPGRK